MIACGVSRVVRLSTAAPQHYNLMIAKAEEGYVKEFGRRVARMDYCVAPDVPEPRALRERKSKKIFSATGS